jgi:uncharacterized membrane protein
MTYFIHNRLRILILPDSKVNRSSDGVTSLDSTPERHAVFGPVELSQTPLSPPATASAGYYGIFWMLLASFLFVSMDTTVKYLVRTYPVPQIVWARYSFHMLFLILFLRGRLPKIMATQRLGIQLFRSLLLLATTGLFFLALRFVPLAKVSAIMFIAPIIVTALSVPLLHERVGVHRWAGVLFGFGGALVMLPPGAEAVAVASLLPLSAACVYAFYQITTRMLSRPGYDRMGSDGVARFARRRRPLCRHQGLPVQQRRHHNAIRIHQPNLGNPVRDRFFRRISRTKNIDRSRHHRLQRSLHLPS